jgi:phenylacetate-CoA ligase
MVVVTDLQNRAMPVIRYQIGDTAVLSDRRCSCGRGLPLLEAVTGRVADYVVTPDGKWISGISLTENFAVMVPGIAQLQIVQEAVDRLVFRVVRGPEFGSTSAETIQRLVTERFGPGVSYTCEFIDRILPEPSGKYRFCISKVSSRYASYAHDGRTFESVELQ